VTPQQSPGVTPALPAPSIHSAGQENKREPAILPAEVALSENTEDIEGEASENAPVPFRQAELAWAALLYESRKFFTVHALRHPPKDLTRYAHALGLEPNKSGELFSYRRASHLHDYVGQQMDPAERDDLLAHAHSCYKSWQRERHLPGAAQQEMAFAFSYEPIRLGGWQLPPLDLACRVSAKGDASSEARVRKEEQTWQEARSAARLVEKTLTSFRVPVQVQTEDIAIGPAIIRLGIRPTGIPRLRQQDEHHPAKKVPEFDEGGQPVYERRTTVAQIMRHQQDIALALAAETIRFQAPVPGRPFVGVEFPRKAPREVNFCEIISSPGYQQSLKSSKLAVGLGIDVTNQVRVASIRKMPHLLVAGTTGAGKTVFLKGLIAGILLHASPEEVRLALVDPKMAEFSLYEGIPHLLTPVVTDMEKVPFLLEHAEKEMERRYRLFASLQVTDLESYARLRASRQRSGQPPLENLPAIVIIIDELADLMLVAPEVTEKHIQRLAQKARATGIHLVLATQRPSVDVITGTIKAVVPTRISFRLSSAMDSRTILDRGGAERLLGRGDMLYVGAESNYEPQRLQAGNIDDDVVIRIVQYWLDEQERRVQGRDADPLDPQEVSQPPLDLQWNLEPASAPEAPPATEDEQPPSRESREGMLSEAQLFEHLTNFLLYETVFVDGTPLPVRLYTLSHEDQLLVAETLLWKGYRGSAELLNRKLRTKRGPALRDELVKRGLMDERTQQPLAPSERLAPLLVECGLLDAETGARLDEPERQAAEPESASTDEPEQPAMSTG